jgi:predicted transcriptional regulator of viral defense system
MNLLEADTKLRKFGYPCVATREVAAYLDISIIYASNVLSRLTKVGRVTRLGRGRWLIGENIDPFAIPEALTNPAPAYISLQSALYHHSMISQIPAVVYAISLARTKRYKNQVGEFSIHHVEPGFFFGFELVGKSMIKIATPEKALIDYLYLSLGRSRSFRSLPELEFSSTFSQKKAAEIIERIPLRAKRGAVRRRYEELVYKSKVELLPKTRLLPG